MVYPLFLVLNLRVNMNIEEKSEYVKEHFLAEAIESIEAHRRYWNSSISRTLTGALSKELENSGYPVFVCEIPPQWEHVFYLQEDAGVENAEIEAIAEERLRVMEQGVDADQLPK